MLKKIKTKTEPYVIIWMQVPVQKKAVGPSGSVWDVENDKSNVEDNLIVKKVRILYHPHLHFILTFLQARLDDALEEIVMKLTDKYPPGLCSLHPNLPCFHHHTSDLHFKLDHPRLLIWAQAIKSGSSSTSYEKIPMLSPMFKASLALKCVSKSAIANTTTTAAATQLFTPNLAHTTPSMPFATLPQYP